MDRRRFLRMLAGGAAGLTTAATMEQAGMLAEFMDWLRRKPVTTIGPEPDRLLYITGDEYLFITYDFYVKNPRSSFQIFGIDRSGYTTPFDGGKELLTPFTTVDMGKMEMLYAAAGGIAYGPEIKEKS